MSTVRARNIPSSLIKIGENAAIRYPDAITVFLSGSLLEGFGNPSSDLDVFVVHSDRSYDLPKEGQSIHLGGALVNVDYSDCIRVDTEHWVKQDIIDVASALSNPMKSELEVFNGPPMHSFELAHSIRMGHPISGADAFRRLFNMFDWDSVCSRLCKSFLATYDDAADDAAGAIEACDAGTALVTSRVAVGAAVDAYLAARGMTNSKPKWRFAKINMLPEREVLADYLSQELEHSADRAVIIRKAEDRIRYAAKVVHAALELQS
jgi:hypothetical protein